MNKPFLIRYWHGRPPKGEFNHFCEKLEELCPPNDKDTNLYWNGTLEEFAHAWQSKFLYYPPTDHEKDFICGTIFVTQWSNWGMR